MFPRNINESIPCSFLSYRLETFRNRILSLIYLKSNLVFLSFFIFKSRHLLDNGQQIVNFNLQVTKRGTRVMLYLRNNAYKNLLLLIFSYKLGLIRGCWYRHTSRGDVSAANFFLYKLCSTLILFTNNHDKGYCTASMYCRSAGKTRGCTSSSIWLARSTKARERRGPYKSPSWCPESCVSFFGVTCFDEQLIYFCIIKRL